LDDNDPASFANNNSQRSFSNRVEAGDWRQGVFVIPEEDKFFAPASLVMGSPGSSANGG
jgi:hypothetical protein